MPFSYLKSISASDEALFSFAGKEVKTKQILAFAALVILALILIHRSVILAIPFFVLGLVYMNYSDDIMTLSSYLSLLQEYRKLTKKEPKPKTIKAPKPKITIPTTEVQLAIASVITLGSGFYGIYSSISSLNFVGMVFGSILIALGIIILLALISPFLNKVLDEAK
ncbi:hypothetical protein [Saccharolobus islandicus]|uniref:Uncharacterized protein n=1 Tax=Saccharolobus islandicus (strain M.16.27) TaxID=427318 RepID=C3N614_SACI3|nr:hypothetical protein [Sulfolobus islandicus]ACP55439.1 hypothetical protein M1627_1555 [Sulfolobus islandicus M.16.27]